MSFSLSSVLEGAFKAGLVTMERILSVVCLISSIGLAAIRGTAIAPTKKRDNMPRVRQVGLMITSMQNLLNFSKNEFRNQFFHIDGRLGFPNSASWFDDLL